MKRLPVQLIFLVASGCGAGYDVAGDVTSVDEAVTRTSPTRTWHQRTGLLIDIAAGSGDSSLWGIDTNFSNGDARVVKWAGSGWAATSQRGIHIAVQALWNGTLVPWVVKADHTVWRGNATGSSWTQMEAPAGGAYDISSSAVPGNFTPAMDQMVSVTGWDGNAYQFMNNVWSLPIVPPEPVTRVAMPNCQSFVSPSLYLGGGTIYQYKRVMNQDYWTPLGPPDLNRQDVSMARFTVNDFTGSMMTVRAGTSNQVNTYETSTNSWISTGSTTFSSSPRAVSSDCSGNRVWIVLFDGRVYYSD